MNDLLRILYNEAYKAYKKEEIPVGCILIKNNEILLKSHNTRESKHDLFGHAEINCIKKGIKKINDWRLNEFDLYVTLMPCEMCQMIIKESRINNVYYLLDNKNAKKIINNMFQIDNDLYKNKINDLMNKMFEKLRN